MVGIGFLLACHLNLVRVEVSANGPVTSIEQAVQVVRAKRKGNSAPAEIWVAGGLYNVPKTIALTAADSNLRIVGAGSSLPRLVGGKRLRHWRHVEDASVIGRLGEGAKAHVMECDLQGEDAVPDMGNLSVRGFGRADSEAGLELFFDGEPAQLARWPNPEEGGGWLKIASVPRPGVLVYEGDRPKKWAPSDDIWTLGYWQFDWAESYEHVLKLDTNEHSLDFGSTQFIFAPLAGRRFYFLNVLEELDEPGEWYLDRHSSKLYFWPPKPIEAGEAIVSTLHGPMFNIEGASNVKLEGLDLEAGRGGGIRVHGGSENWVRGCVVRNFGSYGVDIDGADRSGVRGCDLTGLGEYGIHLNGGDRKTLRPGELVAEDNHIWRYSRWCRTYKPAIQIDGVGNRVAHNLIHDAPHEAVLLSGNDHIVEFNDISRVCTETGDSGAIYMGRDTTMRGNDIRFNRFRELKTTVNTEGASIDDMAVYLDDCFAGTRVYGNIFDIRGVGIMLGGGRDNTIENNLFLDCRPAIHFDARGKGWAAKYFVPHGEWDFFEKIAAMNATNPPYSVRYPGLKTILSDDIAAAKGNRIVSNLCEGGTWLRLLNGLTSKDFEDQNNLVWPDGEKGKTKQERAAAHRILQSIPSTKIGLETRRRPSGGLK